VGFLAWLVKRQITRGQAHFDRSVTRVSDEELAKLLDRAQFDRVQRDPSYEPLVASFLERVARADFEALVTDLENGTIDLNPAMYATDMVIRGTNIGRPFDYNRHYATVCRECARRRMAR
jgi:hypothetical protein